MKTSWMLLIIALAGAVYLIRGRADSWALPEPTKYYSSDKQYYIEIFPRKLESQMKYFDDKVEGHEPAGSAKGVKDNFCKGVFYKRNAKLEYDRVWKSRLSNDVAPVSVLVSDQGEHVVTFDNWHSIGYGDDVVVIYGSGGKLVRKLSLPEIFDKKPPTRVPRSVSSIYWGKGHYLDEKNDCVVLKVVSSWSGNIDEMPEYREVRVNLKTGVLIGPPQLAD